MPELTEMTPTAGGFEPKERPRDPLLQYFEFAHLPPHLQAISAQFGLLAFWIDENLPRNPERTVALRKLLEAKDCAVRAQLFR